MPGETHVPARGRAGGAWNRLPGPGFPTEKADWADLDAHYFRVRRAVFGTMIALTIFQTAYLLTVPGVAQAMLNPIVLGSAGFHCVMIVAAMLVRGKTASIVVLSLLSLRYVFQYLS